jgi:hypothetical protein
MNKVKIMGRLRRQKTGSYLMVEFSVFEDTPEKIANEIKLTVSTMFKDWELVELQTS